MSASEAGWRSMDTAPRDGTAIEARWNELDAQDLVVEWHGSGWWWDDCATTEPDLWRPLGGES